MLGCQGKGGGCKIRVAYSNKCAVIACGDAQASVVARATQREAGAVALADGEDVTDICRVYYSDCTYAGRIW